jgi:uncharacterized protein (DUF924 family)
MQANDEVRRVIGIWVPSGLEQANPETHAQLFARWFGGGAEPMPPGLPLMAAAALSGYRDGWAATPLGRLALIMLLDQAPRVLFAGTRAAYAGDRQALWIAEEGLRNGQYDALEHPWEKTFFILPLANAEGPDHRERLIRVAAMADSIAWSAPEPLRPLYRQAVEKIRGQHAVIERFGRDPHRNAILGRPSTQDEEVWMATGELYRRRPLHGPARLRQVHPAPV